MNEQHETLLDWHDESALQELYDNLIDTLDDIDDDEIALETAELLDSVKEKLLDLQ